MTKIISLCALAVACSARVVDVPSGEWLEVSAPSGQRRQATVSTDRVCGPSGHCEAVVLWGSTSFATESGELYEWALEPGPVLRICASPCPVTLDAQETGAAYRWSELTQSYAWAGWVSPSVELRLEHDDLGLN